MRKNKQTGKNAKTAARKLQPWIILLIAVALIALVMVVLQIIRGGSNGSEATGVATGNFQPVPNPTVNIENLDDLESETYKGLQVEKIGNYSGLFVEDGSNDIVSRVLMIIVKNTGSRTIQYGQIQLTDGSNTASFTLSTLPPGESVVLLEQNRMSYEAGKDLTEVKIENVAVFQQEPTLCEDQLKIQALDGVIPEIKRMEIGVNCKDGNNFDACLIADFEDFEALERYKNDPRHVAVSSLCKSIRTARGAVDFEI